MAKKKQLELLTKKQQKHLQDMVDGMLDVAANVIEEYDDIDLSDLNALSGSVVHISEHSPFLMDVFEGDTWKKVISSMDKHKNKDNDSE